MPTQINEISKVFLHGETLESSELNAIISQINSTIRKLNSVETSLNNHEYDVSIPITNIYCRTKKGINAINFFPQADAKRDELLEEVSNCLTTQGIKYNTNFSTVTLSENADLMNGVWTAYPQGVNESLPHEWEVSYKKLPDNSIMYMFGPVLRSNYGYSGADGDGVQYVYKVFDHELSEIERTNNTPTRPENPNANGEFIPSGWTDDPLGPTAEYPYEYVATLKRINGSWGSFEKISLWSTYTEDGTNGDFLVRVFCRFIPVANKLAPNTPIGGTYNNPQPGSNDNIQWSLTIPSEDNNNQGPVWTSTRVFKGTELATEWSTPAIEADSAELDIEYSSNLEKPALNTLRTIPKTPHPSNNVWHDPSEANIDLSAMVWRAERKIKNGVYDGEWVITKIAGLKGSFKSMVFRRFKPTMLQSTPPIPTGGTYNNPIPDGGLWFDGVPAGDSRTEGPIWASTRIFTDDGVQSNWSSPQLLTDSEDLDIEFSPGIGEEHTQPSNPTGEPFSNREASGWYDSSSINFNSVGPMIWRAERKVDNGQYVGNWTVTRIYGEKGELGYRGDFVSRVFCRSNSLPATPTGGEYDSPIPTNTDLHGVLIWSDGIPATGPGTIYTSSRKFYGNPDLETELGGTWSTPTIEADSNSLDIEYSTSVIEPSANTLRQTPGTAHPVNTGVNWYDPSLLDLIPTDPTTNKPYPIIWRAERRISGTVYDGDWVITRILGEEGPEGRRGSFKSCVFKRSNSVLNDFNTTDDGATYDSPIPTGWSDGIPSGNEALWMAVSKFTGEGDTHSNWTVTLQTDSSDLDVEFSPGIGAGHDCPPMDLTSNNGNTIFTHPINNYEPNGNPPAKTSARIARENAGWYDASALPSGLTIVWRAERKINGLQLYEGDWVITRIYGEKGDPATLTETQLQDLDSAGLQIVVTPLNIILDLSDALTGATDDKIDDITASIVVYNRTGTALANNQYLIKATDGVTLYATNGQIINGVLQPLTPLTDYVEVSGANLTDTKSVKIKNLPITTTTENGNSTYTYTYNKGYIRVILTVPVGTSTKDVRIDIPWYLNKLGERETKIRGDVASTYMSRTVFSNPADPTISAFTASILDGADGRMANYGLLKSKTGGGYEAAFDAQYIQTASENVAKLTKSMTTSNLIADNGWSNTFSSTQINNKYKTACSPFVYLKVGRYIFSTYINSNTSVNNNIKLFAKLSSTKLDPSTLLTDYSNEGWQAISFNGVLEADANTGYEGEYYPSASATPKYVRIYFVFTVETSGTFQEGYYTFHVSLNNTNFTTCLRPQLEICLDSNTDQMPTAWTPGPLDFSSEIKQTADEITTELTGPGGSLSQVKQTLTDITSTVKGIQEGGENLILNGAFLEGTGGTLNWTGWGSPTTREIVTVDGRKWMHIVSTTDQYQGYLQQHSEDFNVLVIPGEKYTLSFRAYSNSGTANVCMGFHWKADPTTTTISSQDWYAFDVSTTPTIYSQTITIPSGVYYFNVMVGDRTTSTQNFYMTEIKFEKGEVATAWTPTRLDTYSKIQLTANSISLLAGVSESTLNIAGLYLRAGLDSDPSMIKVMAGQFKVVLPPEEEGDSEEIIFGNDPSTNTMVFYGDVKTGDLITNDVYDRRMNEINADGTGNLGGRLIDWNPDPEYGGLYIGPGPEDVTLSSLTYLNSGHSDAHYNGDGIRVFSDGTIHFLGDMDGDFRFGKINIHGSDGTLECKWFNIEKSEYLNGSSDKRGISTHIDKDNGMYIKLQTTGDDNVIENSNHALHSNVDWGSIGFGTADALGGAGVVGLSNWENGGESSLDPSFGIYVKGADARTYKGFTGKYDSMYFINGIMIGTYHEQLNKALYGSN